MAGRKIGLGNVGLIFCQIQNTSRQIPADPVKTVLIITIPTDVFWRAGGAMVSSLWRCLAYSLGRAIGPTNDLGTNSLG